MKFEYRKLSIALISLYSACMIFTAYVLFQLQGALVYQSQVMSLSDLAIAGPVFTELYLVVGLTLVVGLAALLINQDKKNAEVIYVEKKKLATAENDQNTDVTSENSSFDMKIVEAIAEKNDDELKIAREILLSICKHMNAGIGILYKTSQDENKRMLEVFTSYALTLGESQTIKYEFGEGLVGQAALEEKTLIIDDIPEGYIKIVSGLGNAAPTHLLLVPIKKGDKLYGVVEIASFTTLQKKEAKVVSAAFEKLTRKLVNSRTAKKQENIPDSGSDLKKQDKKPAITRKKNNKA